MRWGEAPGCLSGRWGQARRASCGFGGWTSARPGEEGGALGWRRAIGRPWGRRSRWALPEGVCAGMEALRRSRKLQAPAASLPSGLAGSQFAGRKCTVCVFSNFKEEGSPWPPLPFWDWSGCVYWGAGSAGQPCHLNLLHHPSLPPTRLRSGCWTPNVPVIVHRPLSGAMWSPARCPPAGRGPSLRR